MLIAVLVLGVVLTRPATGQRLVSDFPRVAEVAVPRIGPLRVGGPLGICASPVVRTLLGAAGGAVAGYLAYRLIISPFTSDESATHGLRTFLVVGGVGVGIVSANRPAGPGCRR